MRSHKHKFVFGRQWGNMSLAQYQTNCKLLLEYHGHTCPDNVDWQHLKARFNVCDAAHWLMGDWREKEAFPKKAVAVMHARNFEGTRHYGGER